MVMGTNNSVARYSIAVAIFVVTLVAYWQNLSNDFVNWDDHENFLHNGQFGPLSWSTMQWAFTTKHLGVYQPVSWLLLCAQYSVAGLQPVAYHLVSNVLHAATALAYYFLVIRILSLSALAKQLPNAIRDRAILAGAAVSALLFSIHPLRVEAVAWISGQPYLPATLFSVLCVSVYLKTHAKPKSPLMRGMLLTWCLYLLATLSKAAAISLPAVLLLMDYYPLRRMRRGLSWPQFVRIIGEKIPFVLIALGIAYLAIDAKAQEHTLWRLADVGLAERVAQAAYGVWFYLGKTLWPVNLSPFYPISEEISLAAWPFMLGAVALLVTTVAIVLARRSWSGLFVAWMSYLALLAPVSHVMRIGNQIAADRYCHIAGLALWPLIGVAIVHLWQRRAQGRIAGWSLGVGHAVPAACLVMLAFGVERQLQIWRSSKSLLTYALQRAPDCEVALVNLGAEYLAESDVERAVQYFERALVAHPDSGLAHNNLGMVAYQQQQYAVALSHFKNAVELLPTMIKAQTNLGATLMRLNQPTDAIEVYRRALALDSRNPTTHGNLANALMVVGQRHQAIEHLQQSVRVRPNHANTQFRLGLALAQEQRYESAMQHLEHALALQSGHRETRIALGRVYVRLGLDAKAQALMAASAHGDVAPRSAATDVKTP